MVFSLSAFWWRRIRGLWKLPDGIDWVLFWWAGPYSSKSLIQFSVERRGCVPSLLFDLRPDWIMKIMATSFKRSQCPQPWSRTIKKAEHGRIDAFELWCWRRLLRVPWIARRSNQSILKEISPEYSLEGLKLKLQYFGYLTHLKRPWYWERLKAGGEGVDRGWDGWLTSSTRWTWVWVNSRSWWWTGRPCVLQSVGSQSVRHDWATELNWTEAEHANFETSWQFSKETREGKVKNLHTYQTD